MSYEISGKLIAKYEEVQRSTTFKTREFVIEKSEDINGRTITNYVKFQCVQDKTAIVDRFTIGEEVKVFFNIKGTKWQKDGKENYITNLDAWRMETNKLGSTSTSNNPIPPPPPPSSFSDAALTEDDLPF